MSLHDKLTERGKGRNEALLFIEIKQVKDLYTLLYVFLGVHHTLGDLKAPSRSAPHIFLCVFLLHMIQKQNHVRSRAWR